AAVGCARGDLRSSRIVGIRDQGKRRPRQGRAKSDAVGTAVDVSAIVENRPAQLRSQERQAHGKAEFLVQHQQRLSANRETRGRIARPRLIQRKSAQRRSSPGKESLRQRYDGRRGYGA